MKLNKIAGVIALASFGLAGIAQADVSANIGATSNYLWRGVTQTSDEAAIQGGIDWDSGAGFYAGTWASNVTGGEETDFYGGYAGEMGDFGYDVGAIYYWYPSISNADFTEIYGIVSFSFFEAGVYYTVDTEAGGSDNHIYYYGGGSFDIGSGWSVGATVGHYDFDGASGRDYSHGQIDVTKSAGDFGDFTMSVSKAGKNSGDDDAIVLVSWAKSFN